MKHTDDGMSVDLTVKILQSENYNPVLLYKPQGATQAEIPRVCAESFLLAIQTQFQREMFEKFGSEILCIDSTHPTNAYGFKLITCIVADHHGQGRLLHYVFTHVPKYINLPIAALYISI